MSTWAPGLRLFAFGLAAAAGCSALVGCTTVDGAVKKEGPAAKATLGKLAQAAADLATRPLVTTDAVTLPAAPLLLAVDRTAADILVTYLEDLTAPGELGPVSGRVGGTDLVTECASFLDHQTYAWIPGSPSNWERSVFAADVETTLAACGRAKVAFVIRTTELVNPGRIRMLSRVPTGTDAGASVSDAGTRDAGVRGRPTGTSTAKKLDAGPDAAADAGAPPPVESMWGAYTGADSTPTAATCRGPENPCRFDGWYVKAEVHVFTLEPFAHQGAFVFEAESAERISFETSASASDLEKDFTRATKQAFVSAVKKNVPGVVVVGLP